MHPDIELILRTITAFILVLFIARMLGKMLTSQMSFHDFVVVITLGSIAGNLAFNLKISTWHLIISLFTFGGFAYLLSAVALKSRSIRKWVSGKPTVLIEDGKILEHNMRKAHYSLDTLNQELRQKDVFDIDEVQYAILELNGKLSVLKKDAYRGIVKKDIGIVPNTATNFPIELIMDSKAIHSNLAKHGLTESWLHDELKKQGLTLSEVFYAVKSSNGHLYWDLYKDHLQKPIDKE